MAGKKKPAVAQSLLSIGHEIQFEKTQAEQDGYVLGPECARNCRNLTTYRKLEQGGTLHREGIR